MNIKAILACGVVAAVIGAWQAQSVVSGASRPASAPATSTASAPVGAALTERDEGGSFSVTIGQTVTLRLRNNRRAAIWQASSNDDCLREVSHEFRHDADAPKGDGNDALGEWVFIYKAAAPGTATLTCRHIEQGGPSVKQWDESRLIKTVKMTINIRAAR